MMKEKTSKWTLAKIFTTIAPFISILFLILLWLSASSVNSELVPTPVMVWEPFMKTFENQSAGS